ncbi:hypothetical protein VTL71DRAFT_8068 [Oculimacula yallundae]|uniref:Secreted protein n=1 Tax=Oculimacula yallundae TaxID=86028 RepID=A0ABR4CWL4_9HELO
MQLSSTLVAVTCLTFAAFTMAAPQGFISQEKCTNTGAYGCGTSNNIVVCNTSGKWVTAAFCGSSQHCSYINNQPYCVQAASLSLRSQTNRPKDPLTFGLEWSVLRRKDELWALICVDLLDGVISSKDRRGSRTALQGYPIYSIGKTRYMKDAFVVVPGGPITETHYFMQEVPGRFLRCSYHVKNSPFNGWVYDEQNFTDVRSTNTLLARIVIAKVENEKRLIDLLRNLPVINNDPDWTCRSWLAKASSDIARDGSA